MACFARGVDGRVTWRGCVVQFHPSSLDCLLCLRWKIACVVVLRAEPLSSQEQILLSFINLTMFRSVAFLFFNLVVAALGQSTFIEPANELYPVNWDEVSDTVTITNLPASCKCVDRPQPVTGASATCKFQCSCACDVTPGQCDPNCCCDPECSKQEVSNFETWSWDGCSNSSANDQAVRMCMSTTTLATVNPSFGIREEGPLDGVMCVVKDNNPSKGFYFTDPGVQPASLLSNIAVKPAHSFGHSAMTVTSESSRTKYTVGDRVQVAVLDGNNAVPAFQGYWPLPTAGLDGRCTDANPVRFQEPVTSNTCIRETQDLVADCAAMGLNARRYTSDLLIVKNYQGPVKRLTPVSQYLNIVPGVVRDSANIIPGLTINNTGVLPATSYDTTTATCVNVLVSAHYHVHYNPSTSGTETKDSGAEITSITVDAVLMNISGTGAKSILQEFLVDFRSTATPSTSLAQNNNYNKSRSGNPGYMVGRPVLAGLKQTLAKVQDVSGEKNAISVFSGGLRFPLRAAGNGACKSLSEGYGDQVLFGMDTKIGCTVSMTPAALKTMCNAKSVPSYFNLTKGQYIGMYGNSNPLNLDPERTWLPMTVGVAPTSSSYAANEEVCTNLITGVEYEFLVANVGSFSKPQTKIISARVVYKTSTIYVLHHLAQQNIVLTSSATFVTLKDKQLEEYVPPAPPFLPVLPYDVFYPFTASAAARQGPWSSIVSVMASLLCGFVLSSFR
jgi:tectonic-1/3